MKNILITLACLLGLPLLAANPTFSSFVTGQFTNDGIHIGITNVPHANSSASAGVANWATNGTSLLSANLSEEWKRFSQPLPLRMFNDYLTGMSEANAGLLVTDLVNNAMVANGYNVYVTDAGFFATNQGNNLLTNYSAMYPDGPFYMKNLMNENGVIWGLWITALYDNIVAGVAGQQGFAGTNGDQLAITVTNINRLCDWGVGFIKWDGAGATNVNAYGNEEGQIAGADGESIIASIYQGRNMPLIMNGGGTAGIGASTWPTPSEIRVKNSKRAPQDGIVLLSHYQNIDWCWTNLQAAFAAGEYLDPDTVEPILWASVAGLCQKTELAYDALMPLDIVVPDQHSFWGFYNGSWIYGSAGFNNQYYTNSGILSMQQDLGRSPAKLVWRSNPNTTICTKIQEVGLGHSSDGTPLVGIFNRGQLDTDFNTGPLTNVTISLSALGLPADKWTAYDAIGGVIDSYVTNGLLSYNLQQNDCKLLRMYRGQMNPFITGTNYLENYPYNLTTYSNSTMKNLTFAGDYNNWRFMVNTDATHGFASPMNLPGITVTNGFIMQADAGLTWFFGGNVQTFSFTLGEDTKVIYAMGPSYGNYPAPTNLVTVYADGSVIFSSLVMTNSPIIATNLAVAGVQQLRITVTEQNPSMQVNNSDHSSLDLVDFVNPLAVAGNVAATLNLQHSVFTLASDYAETNIVGSASPLALTLTNSGYYEIEGRARVQGLGVGDYPNVIFYVTNVTSGGYCYDANAIHFTFNDNTASGYDSAAATTTLFPLTFTGDGYSRISVAANPGSQKFYAIFKASVQVTNPPVTFFISAEDNGLITDTNTIYKGSLIRADQY